MTPKSGRSGSTGLGVHKGDGSSVTTIAELSSLSGQPSINNSGRVAFTSNVGGPAGREILAGDGGPLTSVLVGSSSQLGIGGPKFNDNDAIAFKDSAAISVIQGGSQTTIATDRDADSTSPFTVLGDFSLNNTGTVSFSALQFGGPSGIFSGDGGAISTVVDTSGIFSGFGAGPAINDSGDVAFLASLDAGGEGIFVKALGGITTIADSSGGISSFAAGPALNDSEVVAFIAHLDVGGAGIFTGPDLTGDLVIRTGGDLFGSTVASLLFSSPALNELGQIAFTATLADGRTVIARADPVAAFEPTTILLLGLDLAGLGFARRRLH